MGKVDSQTHIPFLFCPSIPYHTDEGISSTFSRKRNETNADFFFIAVAVLPLVLLLLSGSPEFNIWT
jgi:nitrate reductase NapE component